MNKLKRIEVIFYFMFELNFYTLIFKMPIVNKEITRTFSILNINLLCYVYYKLDKLKC